MLFSPQNATLNPKQAIETVKNMYTVRAFCRQPFPGNFNEVRRFKLGIGLGVAYIPGKGLHRPHWCDPCPTHDCVMSLRLSNFVSAE